MAIAFETIPANLLVEGVYTETNSDRAVSTSPQLPRRIVVVGQRLTAGASAAGVPFRVFREGDADYHAGVGSMLAEMLRVAKRANTYVELWGIGLADAGAGVSATCTLTFTGNATAKGVVALLIGGYWVGPDQRGKYPVLVNSGDTPTAIGTAVAAAINADPYRCVDAAAVAGVVTLTARHKGVLGNSILASHSFYDNERLPAGVTLAITAMASGATNPVVSSAIAALGDAHTTHLVNPYTDATSLTAFENEMTRRWGGTVQRECHHFSAASGSTSTLTTLGDGRNSELSSIFDAGLGPTPPWIVAAEAAAVDAAEFHPGRPLRGLQLKAMIAPKSGLERTGDERQALLADGISTITVDAGGACRIGRIVSTHQRDINGNPTSVFRDRQVAGLLFALRFDWRTFIGGKYPRHMHSADGSIYAPGLPIISPSTIKADAAGRARSVWQYDQGWIEDPEQLVKDLVVERTEDGMDMIIVPNLINRFHIHKMRLDFLR